jgi:hypothetical protein
MTATPSIELPAWMAEQLSQASPDLLRQMVQIMTLVRARAPTRCVRIGVADQVKKILGTGGVRRRRRREGQRGAQRSEDTSS